VKPDAPPTVRQVYALAAVLCELCDEEFPEDREAASTLIERLRRELGHPQPRLEDTTPHRRKRRPSAKTREIRRFFHELNAKS
jgi:hypothetical protein